MTINNKYNLKKISIKSYALGFIFFYILVFSISTFFAFMDILKLNGEIIETDISSGTTELIEAINQLVNNHETIVKDFSAWDEVRQQLDTPEHYPYWQTHRLLKAGKLPDFFIEASLYEKSGKTLNKISTTTLPGNIITDKTSPYFNVINNTIQLVIITPVLKNKINKTSKTAYSIAGYVATKSIVFSQLKRVKQFNHIVADSIKLKIHEKNHIEVEQLINFLTFKIKENTEIIIISNQVKQILIKNALVLIIFALMFYFLISYFLSRPLHQMSAYIDTLENQAELQPSHDLDLKFHIHELEKVKVSLRDYQKKLQTVYSNLDEKNQELWDMAHHDALTGALNRRAFEEHWANIATLFSNSRCPVSLILFDINQFKSINDSYGHPVGDEVLKKIASAIQRVLRQGEKIYRIGGDEFSTILYNCKPEEAIFIASRCQTAISEISFATENIKEPIRASIGVAHNNAHETASISDLLWQADIAVYSAKKPGHSHIVTYSEKIKSISSTILSTKINNLVFDAIETGNNIHMFYQPIINLKNEKTDYYEALLRIKDNGEVIAPGKIFQLIEAKKLDHELDIVIFKQISSDLKQGYIPANTGVSINVSGPSIIHPEIVERLSVFSPYLKEYKIVLEITETSLITNIDQATENINKLKQIGFLIALDDFGSGYSSISYLASMPVDIVKFDISLIRQLEDDKQFSIIHHLANMIRETGHLLIAEGIETKELKDKIKHLGFNYAQGYLYGKPSPLSKSY